MVSQLSPTPVFPGNLPILYEDDEEGDLGESNPHVLALEILHLCISVHLAGRQDLQVFADLNLYYPHLGVRPDKPMPYISPDLMVVQPFQPLPTEITSYQIGREGPAPFLTAEVLSERSAQQRDLNEKVKLCAALGVAEYVLVDVSGRFLPQRLLMKRLQPDGTYRDEQDPDGGVSSKLAFRLIIDSEAKLSVINALTGKPYVRPKEAVERMSKLEEEVARLRQRLQERNGS